MKFHIFCILAESVAEASFGRINDRGLDGSANNSAIGRIVWQISLAESTGTPQAWANLVVLVTTKPWTTRHENSRRKL